MPISFVEALKAKYCEDEEDDHCSNDVVHIVYTNRPRKNSSGVGDPELGYLKSVVLSMNKVTHAGIPSEGLSSLCPNIVDLDLSYNLIGCWQEIINIFKSLDNLKFVNLSGNKLHDTKGCLKEVGDLTFTVENLVLNSTDVPWDNIVNVARCLPRLRELHASKNGYQDVPVDGDVLRKCLHNLQILHLNDNKLIRWEQVAKLSFLPHLHTLILSENPLSNVHYDASTVIKRNSVEGEEDEVNETEMCCKEQDEGTVEQKEMIDAILEMLIHETLRSSREPTPKKMPTDAIRDEASDPTADDSGMEDSHPNTPRHNRRQQPISQSSQDGDQLELSDSGFGSIKAAASKSGDHKEPCNSKDSVSQSGETVCESDTVTHPASCNNLVQNEMGEHAKITNPACTELLSDSASPGDGGTKVEVSTNKFAYFEVSWDAEDEAIGPETEADEEVSVIEGDQHQNQCKDPCENRCGDRCDVQCEAQIPFQNLQVLCMTDTHVSHWSYVGSLRLFPSLKSLRVKGVPFLREMDEDERRKLLVASLPNIQILNGSEIIADDREKSERHFIRHFSSHPEPPAWYEDLVKRHGNLKPITEIDLSQGFQEFATLSFVYQGRCLCQDSIHIVESVRELRKYCAKLVKKHDRSIRLFHLSKSVDAENPEHTELVCQFVPMSRYDMMDGDEIHIDIRSPRIPCHILESRARAEAVASK